MSYLNPTSSARRAISAFAAVAAGVLVLGAAAPAFAAGRTLPTGDQLFAIECDGEYFLEPQLYSVDAATAAITKVGEGTYPTAGEQCAFQAAHDVTTGISYFVDVLDLDGLVTVLSTIDTVTGQSAQVGDGNFDVVGDINANPFILSIAIGKDGAAYAIDSDDFLYSLNLTNADLTLIAQLNATGQFRAFGSDPRNGQFYIANATTLFTLDVAAAVATPVYDFDFVGSENRVRSLQVDSTGVIWIDNSPGGPAQLWSTTGTAASELLSGDFLEGDPFVYTESLLLVPAPALAATGSEFAPVALIAGLGILTLGGALVLIRRRAAA